MGRSTFLTNTKVKSETRKNEVVQSDRLLPVRKSRVQLQRQVLMPSFLSFNISLDKLTVLNGELKSMNIILA